MNRRPGISLAEVLIAIFVLGLALLGILSLFPLGAVRIAQAIKDDRCQNHNLNTAANFHYIWRFETVNSSGVYRQLYPVYNLAGPNPNATPTDYGDRIDPFTCAQECPNYPPNPDGQQADPNAWIPAAYQSPLYPQYPLLNTSASAVVPRGTQKKSYSVYVDPIGWNNGANNASNPQMQYWVGGNTSCIPRRSLRRIEWAKNPNLPAPQNGLYTVDLNTAYGFDIKRTLRNRYLVLLEDLGFARDGTPADASGNYSAANPPATGMNGQIQRDGRYSCALLFRRRQTYVHRLLEMTVVVYSGRPADGPSDEKAYTTRFTKGSTEATVYWDPNTETRPRIRK